MIEQLFLITLFLENAVPLQRLLTPCGLRLSDSSSFPICGSDNREALIGHLIGSWEPASQIPFGLCQGLKGIRGWWGLVGELGGW